MCNLLRIATELHYCCPLFLHKCLPVELFRNRYCADSLYPIFMQINFLLLGACISVWTGECSQHFRQRKLSLPLTDVAPVTVPNIIFLLLLFLCQKKSLRAACGRLVQGTTPNRGISSAQKAAFLAGWAPWLGSPCNCLNWGWWGGS